MGLMCTMNRNELMYKLVYMDLLGKFVFTMGDIKLWFNEEPEKTVKAALKRHIHANILHSPCRGIYIYPQAKSADSYILEHIAKALRRGEYSYVSLESALSEAGVISQIPLDTLTIMTTGRSQTYNTSYGTIEFTHTKKAISNILSGVYSVAKRPLRVATVETALQDLKRTKRNTDLIDLGD